jgi:hypothetical protein
VKIRVPTVGWSGKVSSLDLDSNIKTREMIITPQGTKFGLHCGQDNKKPRPKGRGFLCAEEEFQPKADQPLAGNHCVVSRAGVEPAQPCGH